MKAFYYTCRLLPTKRRDKPISARARASDNRFSLSRKLCIASCLLLGPGHGVRPRSSLWGPKAQNRSRRESPRSRPRRISLPLLFTRTSFTPATRTRLGKRSAGNLTAGRREAAKRAPTESAPDSVAIPLTTVSRWGNFDAYISIQFRSSSGLSDSLLVDRLQSGNSVLIVPHGENLVGLPDYTVLGEEWSHEVVPAISSIDISTTDGSIYTASSMHVLATTRAREAVALPTLAQAAQHLGF